MVPPQPAPPAEIMLATSTLPAALSPELRRLHAVGTDIQQRGVPANTTKAREADWRTFVAWCQKHPETSDLVSIERPFLLGGPVHPDVVWAYVTALADGAVAMHVRAGERSSRRKYATIARHVATIAHYHYRLDLPSPTRSARVRELMRSVRNEIGEAPTQKRPALAADIRAAVATIDAGTAAGVRDRAVLLVGFGSAMRRSEIAGLSRADVTLDEHGVVLHLRKSKGDQAGRGRKIRVMPSGDAAACPAAALRAWLAHMADAGIVPEDGALFPRLVGPTPLARIRASHVADVVKTVVEAIGYDPTQFAGHSLRAGFVTSAAMAGKDLVAIQEQTRHKSLDTLRGYVREFTNLQNHPGKGLL